MTNNGNSHHACDCQSVSLENHYGKTTICFSRDTPSLWAHSWHSSLHSWQCPTAASLCPPWEPALQPLSAKCKASCINSLSMKLSCSQQQNIDYTILIPARPSICCPSQLHSQEWALSPASAQKHHYQPPHIHRSPQVHIDRQRTSHWTKKKDFTST